MDKLRICTYENVDTSMHSKGILFSYVMMNIRSSILILLYIPHIFSSSYLTDRDLRDTLLKGYNKDVRPVRNITQNLNIDLYFKSIVIFNLDLFEGMLHSKVIIESRWTDEYLCWDPIKYDNLTHIEFNSDSIWAPNIFVSNAEKVTKIPSLSEYITVSYDGRTSYFIRSIYRTYCSIDFYKYPFSLNVCKIYFWLSNEMVSYLKLQNVDLANTSNIWTTIWNIQLDGHKYDDDNSTDGFELIIMLEQSSSANNIAIIIGILLLSLLTILEKFNRIESKTSLRRTDF
ncbi:acetylcholine receptor subunit beta-type unc-29 [Octopus bimaculoides]|uniref:acetylcholine receptor subunit beta-type unc-29 n=1 Tax=Octopus bimaculoides TaxID=37653 RepID=UPI0022E8686F|nr:acetylcholine receptor subunit beta-type unc-29 [Octopus bimaculoides]